MSYNASTAFVKDYPTFPITEDDDATADELMKNIEAILFADADDIVVGNSNSSNQLPPGLAPNTYVNEEFVDDDDEKYIHDDCSLATMQVKDHEDCPSKDCPPYCPAIANRSFNASLYSHYINDPNDNDNLDNVDEDALSVQQLGMDQQCKVVSYNDNNIYDDSSYNSLNNHSMNTHIEPFYFDKDLKLRLEDHIFISKDCTRRLGLYIVKEPWGYESGLLYKYLDYIFRCQVFNREVIRITDDTGRQSLIFHTGLQRATDLEFLYIVLIPNKSFRQKWRVSFGKIDKSFLSEADVLAKYKNIYGIKQRLPKRTVFAEDLSDLLFDNKVKIEVNWEERLITCRDRIHKILGNAAFFDYKAKFIRLTDLIETFEIALKETCRLAALNPRIAVPQGFVDTKHCQYRIELLLPVVIEFPKHSRMFYTFVLAMGQCLTHGTKKYVIKSVLTMDMGYANARLVGYVDSQWLYYGNRNNGRMNLNEFVLCQ